MLALQGVLRRQHCSVHAVGMRTYSALQATAHGDPEAVLELVDQTLPEVGPGEAAVEMLAAPIHPSDINTVQGTYPLKPQLPFVPGNEGVCRIQQLGSQAGSWQTGDLAVPMPHGQGTWRQQAVLKLRNLWRVPKGISATDAATMHINPVTALRMLTEFADLQEGDVVVQNGATSAVGKAVIQIAHKRGYITINEVRSRPAEQLRQVEDELKGLGATHVITTEQLADRDARKRLLQSEGLKEREVRLALNCVGGSSALALASCLGRGGKLVTYGAMGRTPVQLPPAAQIFKGISAYGFWLSGDQDIEAKGRYLQEVADLIRSGGITSRVESIPLERYKEAVRQWGRSEDGAKLLFTF